MAYTLNLRSLRKERNLTQAALAKKSGVSRGIIGRIESDRDYVTTTATLRKLAVALDIPVSALFSA